MNWNITYLDDKLELHKNLVLQGIDQSSLFEDFHQFGREGIEPEFLSGDGDHSLAEADRDRVAGAVGFDGFGKHQQGQTLVDGRPE